MQSRSRGWIASAVGSEGRLFAAGGRKCVAGSVVKVKLSVGIRELPRFGRVDPCAPGVRAVFLQDSKMDSTTPTPSRLTTRGSFKFSIKIMWLLGM